MNKSDCFELGHITKTHGVKGEVVLFLDVDDPNPYEDMDSLFLDRPGGLVPFFVERLRLQDGLRAIVKFENVATFEEAEALRGAKAYLPLDVLPPLEEGQFYFHEVLGFTVVDERLGPLGEVDDIYAMPSQDLIAMRYKGKEVLIPITDELVPSISRDKKELYVSLPEGLLEIYLGE